MRIGIVGGTGREGRGLAVRWARAGHEVVIGSRDAERGRARAEELSASAGVPIAGGGNADAAAAELVVLTVPYSAHAATLDGLADALDGKILVDITVPLQPPKVRTVHLPEGTAAALEAQALVPGARVVSTLHHISSAHLGDPDHAFDSDVLVCGDAEARPVVVGLIEDLGLRALEAGPLQNAVALEAMTSVLLFLNKRYGGNAGLRITGLG